MARTARMVAQPDAEAGAAPKFVPSDEYVRVHPEGATMPLAPVTRARDESKDIVIDWETVPGAATGTRADTVNMPPPSAEVVCKSVLAVTARETADAVETDTAATRNVEATRRSGIRWQFARMRDIQRIVIAFPCRHGVPNLEDAGSSVSILDLVRPGWIPVEHDPFRTVFVNTAPME